MTETCIATHKYPPLVSLSCLLQFLVWFRRPPRLNRVTFIPLKFVRGVIILFIMEGSVCRIHMDGGILGMLPIYSYDSISLVQLTLIKDIGARYAIYGTAFLTICLGCLSMFSVNRLIRRGGTIGPTPLLLLQEEMIRVDDEMYNNIRSHKKSMRPVSTTLNLTGVAMVCAAFVHQSDMVQQRASEASTPNPQGPFTLFHAYTLLSLLWLITLVGMMIHVQTWVCITISYFELLPDYS
jgi:hypothetical protein